MMNLLRRLSLARSGASAMEFALLATPLAAMLFGVLEFGRLQWTRNALEEVAIAGARCVGVRANECAGAAVPGTSVRSYDASRTREFLKAQAINMSVRLPNAGVIVSTTATCQGIANFTQVTIRHQFTSGFLTIAGLDPFQIDAVACFPNPAA